MPTAKTSQRLLETFMIQPPMKKARARPMPELRYHIPMAVDRLSVTKGSLGSDRPVGEPAASAVPTAARPRNRVQRPTAKPQSAVAPLHIVNAIVIKLRRL